MDVLNTQEKGSHVDQFKGHPYVLQLYSFPLMSHEQLPVPVLRFRQVVHFHHIAHAAAPVDNH